MKKNICLFAAAALALSMFALYSFGKGPKSSDATSATSRSEGADIAVTKGTMSVERAEKLIQAWSGGSLSKLNLGSGKFLTLANGVFFRFESEKQRLLASGLVGSDAHQFTASKKPWQDLQTTAARESNTLGEGNFELVPTKLFNSDPPVLLLTKDFANGAISEEQFLIEVSWLREWATHWRKKRMVELTSGLSPQEIERRGQDHVEWAKRNRPRPW